MLAAQQKEKKRIRNKERKCDRTRKEREKKEKKIGGWDSILIMRNLPRDLHYRPRIHYIEW